MPSVKGLHLRPFSVKLWDFTERGAASLPFVRQSLSYQKYFVHLQERSAAPDILLSRLRRAQAVEGACEIWYNPGGKADKHPDAQI